MTESFPKGGGGGKVTQSQGLAEHQNKQKNLVEEVSNHVYTYIHTYL